MEKKEKKKSCCNRLLLSYLPIHASSGDQLNNDASSIFTALQWAPLLKLPITSQMHLATEL